MGCAATVRGALEPLAGVSVVDVLPGRKKVFVACDPKRVQAVDLLAALEKAGEHATLLR
jgi:copper chaperone CopZ